MGSTGSRASRSRSLHLALFLGAWVVVGLLIRERPEPSTKPAISFAQGSFYMPSDSINELGVALYASMEAERSAISQSIEEERERVRVAALRASETWPTSYHREVRQDEAWSLSGAELFMTVENFQLVFPETTARDYGGYKPEPDWIMGNVHGEKINGGYDMYRRVRVIGGGQQLEMSGQLLLRVGDSRKTVEEGLGYPNAANPSWGASRPNGVTYWTYDYESTIIVLSFYEGRLRSIHLRDRNFNHSRC